MIYIGVFFFIIVIISYFIKIRLKVTKKEEANVDLIISRLFNLQIDLDKLLRDKLSFGNVGVAALDVLNFFKIYLENRGLIYDYMRQGKITKITVIPRWNTTDPVWNVYVVFMNWQLNSLIKAYLDDHFQDQLDEYYQVIIKNDGTSKGISFEIEIKMRLIALIMVTIKNIIPIFKVIKINRRRNRDERTSD